MFKVANWAAILGATLFAAAACMSPALAQEAEEQPVPCSAPEYRHMDFWVGHWDAKWMDADGTEQHGSNTITHQLGGCMIQEDFNGNPAQDFIGRSMSEYLPRFGAWKQVWMDNGGGYFALTGGMVGEEFILVMDRALEDAPYMRMVFTNITEQSFDWRWQGSTDEGESWEDRWVINYTRIE